MKRKVNQKITDEQFIEEWNNCTPVLVMMAKYGISRELIRQKKNKLKLQTCRRCDRIKAEYADD